MRKLAAKKNFKGIDGYLRSLYEGVF